MLPVTKRGVKRVFCTFLEECFVDGEALRVAHKNRACFVFLG